MTDAGPSLVSHRCLVVRGSCDTPPSVPSPSFPLPLLPCLSSPTLVPRRWFRALLSPLPAPFVCFFPRWARWGIHRRSRLRAGGLRRARLPAGGRAQSKRREIGRASIRRGLNSRPSSCPSLSRPSSPHPSSFSSSHPSFSLLPTPFSHPLSPRTLLPTDANPSHHRYVLRLLGWARKYGLRVNLDLHTAPGSQNGVFSLRILVLCFLLFLLFVTLSCFWGRFGVAWFSWFCCFSGACYVLEAF